MMKFWSLPDIRAVAAQTMSNGIIRATTILLGGALVAHLITAISLPIITRLYQPQDMGTLAVFTSLLTILSVSISLRFEYAVSISEDDGEAANLLAVGAASAFLGSVILAAVMAVLPSAVYELLDSPDFVRFWWLLPPAVMIAGLYNLVQFWFVRHKAFRSIAYSRITQSAASAGAQISLGFAGIAPFGLILGVMLNSSVGSAILGAHLIKTQQPLRSISLRRMWNLFLVNSQFPKYSAPEAFINAVSVSLPIVFVAAFAGSSEAGYLMLALLVLQAPMSLLGTAMRQVYLSEAPSRFRANTLTTFTVSILGGLLKSGAGPLIAIGIVSPFVFGFLFGEAWTRSGELVTWMTPWFLLHFLVSPMSPALQVIGRQRTALALQLFGLSSRMAMVVAAGILAPRLTSEAFAVSGAIFYLPYLGIVLHSVGAKWRDLQSELRRARHLVALWVVLALLVLVAFTLVSP